MHVCSTPMQLETSTHPEARGLGSLHGLANGVEDLLCIPHQELLRGLASCQGGLHTWSLWEESS